ncbi:MULTISPECIES: winged helix-turn-helix domain-containing protein [unclassified Rhizobium]|jgi:TolB-like protein|uniref:winged helix-turn-helix domain-containing protein n=1 Tax=unclassified Rhizobium TaxID=2613769 RepID=UPI00160994BF|nr:MULTISPECIES: winged helix-turn-helix domain-containing protein [unclassified Rhizobium]MBB3314555.1 TolB-like protein [Rhizobium sp. BK181]MBB3539892.1 TolB-like protein [Rhizobium sp. BK399]MCS3739099.1 TolB-like protein [Rhizobium sp. BK661]MCS4090577.1 TolB-like protein [Rhizobium sp. BK176]
MSMFEFAGHQLDMQQGRLRKGGQDVRLRPKSLALLTYLLENSGRVVTKDELVSAVWPNVAVTDGSLSQCVTDIRRTLGEGAAKLIRTVPCRGYALDEKLVRRSEALLAPAAFGPSGRLSIAVLPFTVAVPGGRHTWIADGIVEDIITALAKIPALFVTSKSLSFAYRDKAGRLPDVVRALGVHYVLSGSVRVSGHELRLTTELVDAQTGGIVWADRFDRHFGQIFAVQDEITAAVVERLKSELLPQNRAAAVIENQREFDLPRNHADQAALWDR